MGHYPPRVHIRHDPSEPPYNEISLLVNQNFQVHISQITAVLTSERTKFRKLGPLRRQKAPFFRSNLLCPGRGCMRSRGDDPPPGEMR